MNRALWLAALGVALLLGCADATAIPQRPTDYLTETEADRIRAAQFADPRIRLFLSYADDRLKKFQFELTRTGSDRGRAARLNALLDAYIGCMDDAAAVMDIGRERQEDIRRGIAEMKKKGEEFLEYLRKLEQSGPHLESYRDTLEDAILATKEALELAEKADEESAPPPVRRRP
jgi:hypothetical protein